VSWLLDTNILSELRKGGRAHPRVTAWYASIPGDALFVSVLVLGEIRKGAEMLRGRDPVQAGVIDAWLAQIRMTIGHRLLAFDAACADAWGRIAAVRSVPAEDAMMVATAQVHGLTLVTRNKRHAEGLGVSVLDPFE
jgi:predicted nucleic acid-binding protein